MSNTPTICLSIILCLACTVSAYAADTVMPRPNLGKGIKSYKQLRLQAQQARKVYPQLFDYLEKRDKTLQDTIVTLSKQIPDPSRLPKTKIPFVPPVIERLAPRSKKECQHISDGTLLANRIKERVYWLCRNGIYAKNPEFRMAR